MERFLLKFFKGDKMIDELFVYADSLSEIKSLAREHRMKYHNGDALRYTYELVEVI